MEEREGAHNPKGLEEKTPPPVPCGTFCGNPELKWRPPGRIFGSPLRVPREEGRWACSTSRILKGLPRDSHRFAAKCSCQSRTPQGCPNHSRSARAGQVILQGLFRGGDGVRKIETGWNATLDCAIQLLRSATPHPKRQFTPCRRGCGSSARCDRSAGSGRRR